MAGAESKQLQAQSNGAVCPAPPGAPPRGARKLPVACRLASVRRALVRPLVLGLLVASAASAEPQRGGEPELLAAETITGPATLASEGLLAAWLVMFAALSALYSYEKARAPGRGFVSHPHPPPPLPPPPIEAVIAPSVRFARKPVRLAAECSAAKREPAASPRTVAGAPQAALRDPAPRRPAASPPRQNVASGIVQSGPDAPRAAGSERERPAAPEAPAPAAPAALPLAAGPPGLAASHAVDAAECVRLCAVLRSRGRFGEAARLARHGLAGTGDPAPLLLELSRAERGLGRVEAAIDAARNAHFASRSRESVTNLIQLLTETRRFAREDGPSLRRAAGRHPLEPLLLRAAGVFESMYGSASDAERWLRAALPLAPDEETRRAIAGELAQATEQRLRCGEGPT